MTLFAHLTDVSARLGHRPAVVFRDAASGERTELSFATLHNWTCKTANLLLDRFDAGPGAEVTLVSPLHWTAPIVALGTWATGAALRVGGPPGEVLVAHEGDAPDRADVLLGAGLGGRPAVPVNVPEDAATIPDVLAEPDDFVDDPGDEGAWAIGGRSQASLWAERIEAPGSRILHAADRVAEATVVLLARTLPAGTTVVLARGFDQAGLQHLRTEERVG